jgi:hypothetical protein
MLKQWHWRVAGGICIVTAGFMAYGGAHASFVRQSVLAFSLYWGVFLILFLAALFCAWLDMRYIRAEYALAKRDVFQETLGDEEFRQTLRDAQKTETPPSQRRDN